MSCGRMYFGARSPALYNGETIAQIRARCAANNLVYNPKSRSCRERALSKKTGLPRAAPVRRGPRGPNSRDKKALRGGMTIAQMKALCASDGMVFDPVLGQCRQRKPKGRAPGSMYTGRRNYRYGDASLPQLRAMCKSRGEVFNKETRQCVPKRTNKGKSLGPRGKPTTKPKAYKGMTVAQWKKQCSNAGLTYNGAGGCREKKNLKRYPMVVYSGAGFGMMHSTPSAWRPGGAYFNASKFSEPSLLLGDSFKAVANKAAADSVASTINSVANRAATVAATSAVNSVASGAPVAASVTKAVDSAVSDVSAAFGLRLRRSRRRSMGRRY